MERVVAPASPSLPRSRSPITRAVSGSGAVPLVHDIVRVGAPRAAPDLATAVRNNADAIRSVCGETLSPRSASCAVRSANLESLPREVFGSICRYLDFQDVRSMSRTSRRLRAAFGAMLEGLPRAEVCETLASSASRGHLDHVQFLLQFPAFRRVVNNPDAWGRTALWWAARNGHTQTVQHLLSVPGIDANRCNPLWIAATFRALFVVRALMGRVAVVNARECGQANAVLGAASIGQGWKVTTLFGDIVIPRQPEFEGMRPMDVLDEVAPGLSFRYATTCARQYPCYTPLRMAVDRGYVSIARRLLNDPRTCPNLDSPIVHASWNGHLEIVDALLRRPDIDIDARDTSGLSAQRAAIRGGRYRVVERLLETGRVAPDLEFALQQEQLQNRGALQVIAALEAYVEGRTRSARALAPRRRP